MYWVWQCCEYNCGVCNIVNNSWSPHIRNAILLFCINLYRLCLVLCKTLCFSIFSLIGHKITISMAMNLSTQPLIPWYLSILDIYYLHQTVITLDLPINWLNCTKHVQSTNNNVLEKSRLCLRWLLIPKFPGIFIYIYWYEIWLLGIVCVALLLMKMRWMPSASMKLWMFSKVTIVLVC